MYYWPSDIPIAFKPLSYPNVDLSIADNCKDFGEATVVELTEEEQDYVDKITKVVGYTPNNLSGQIKPFRAICQYQPKDILEIGPGHGYLGALLGLKGYPYTAIEVIEGLHKWQGYLWSSLSLSNKQLLWWDHKLPIVDLVYANANLAEMTSEGLEYYLSNLQGCNLMYMNLGAEYGSTHEHVKEQLKKYNINAIQI